MSRTCPMCHESMAGQPQTAIFHPECGRERRKIIDRLDKRARYHGEATPRFCCICLGPREKGKRMCAGCLKQRQREGYRRYSVSPKGRAAWARYSQSPKAKLTRAARVERNPESVRRARMRYESKRPRRSGTAIPCSTLLCSGTFIRSRHNSRRLFCDECQFVHKTITHAEAMRRGTRRYYGKAA